MEVELEVEVFEGEMFTGEVVTGEGGVECGVECGFVEVLSR